MRTSDRRRDSFFNWAIDKLPRAGSPRNAFLLLAWLVWIGGCSGSGGASSAPQNGPWIKATPNPIPASAEKGVTTISWDTGDGSLGYVAFAINGSPEKAWFSKRPKGSQEIDWIKKGGTYEFRLYPEKDHEKLLASVKVTKQ